MSLRRHAGLRGWRTRRGSALILVLLMTLAVAALAIAAIFMTSSAGLLSRFYDKERLFRLAAESALERTRSRLLTDLDLAIPDTGMIQLLSGWVPSDASGTPLGGVAVNVYAAVTGDTTGLWLPHVTLLAASYDATGTRHVRRMDLQRESFSRYQYFVDSFPSTTAHGPGVVGGRVHSNINWVNSSSGNRFLDTVSVVGSISGTATFEVDSLVGVVPIPYPRDSTFLRLDTLALNAGLRFAPLTGSARGTRLEFVAFDADNDGTVEESEGFFKVFDISTTLDTTYLRGNAAEAVGLFSAGTAPTIGFFVPWTDPRIQNQCGAFYKRSGRWHFYPIATHRATWARPMIQQNSGGAYPSIPPGTMNALDNYDWNAANTILQLPTAQCFPAGSPYLMPTERKTNEFGVVTGTPADTIPFGVVTPGGGWVAPFTLGYGGMDSTFTIRSRTCTISTASTTGRCNTGTLGDLGAWRTGTNPAGISTSVRQATETPYLWAYGSAFNATSRGVISVTGSPIFVSGTVRGRVTLRAAGRVMLVDRLRFHLDPNDEAVDACSDQLGIVAVGDVLVVAGIFNRVVRVGIPPLPGGSNTSQHMGGEGRFTGHGAWMSLTGTVGVESPASTMGATASQMRCPDDAGTATRSNGGCYALTGGAIMKTYSALYSGTATGFRYLGAPDRCQSTDRRPPFFPLTNRYVRVRTLEIEPSLANNPTKIRTLLMRLKGPAL